MFSLFSFLKLAERETFLFLLQISTSKSEKEKFVVAHIIKKKQSHDRKGRETTEENKAYFLYINQIEMARGGLIIIYV